MSESQLEKGGEQSTLLKGLTNTSSLPLRDVETGERTPDERTPDERSPLKKTPEKRNPSPPRRADIDVIVIFLTYGIYLFHLCTVYISDISVYNTRYPNMGTTSPVAENPFTGISLVYIVRLFFGFMHAWQMPMFFYLSGQNAYFALFRRSETQFRDERVHRLLVPALFLSVVTQLPLTLGYFAPHKAPLGVSYWEYAQGFYKYLLPSFRQAWFLVYLFVYAQMFTYWFRAYHPAHNTADTTTLSCCGSTACCCSAKPFNCLTKFCCCLNFLLKPATTPEEFVSAVKWFLGGPIRLALIPGVLIGVVQTAHNTIPYGQIVPVQDTARVLQRFPFFPQMLVFVLGYAMGAADKEIRQDNKLWSWTCFIVGAVLCVAYGPEDQVLPGTLLQSILQGFTQGIGQWLFLMGATALARAKFTASRDWHNTSRMMAMPFYLIHQQVIVTYVAGALWVPYLRTLPITLLITSSLTLTLSYLITKSGSLRYFFGLPPPRGSCLPGTQLRGFVPAMVLSGLVALHILLANIL